jgi:uncharacterized protein
MGKFLLLFLIIVMASCTGRGQEDYLGSDVRIFKEVNWELAQAVEKEDTLEIERIIREGDNVDVQDPKYKKTLLIWSVSENKFESATKLLKLGADPNLPDSLEGISAIIAAANKYETSDYLRLVMRFGGDPNNESKVSHPVENRTPLIAAAKNRLESVKILLEGGANLNYGIESGESALINAVIMNQVEVVHYLLIEKEAEFRMPVLRRDDGSYSYVVDFLRYWTFPLDSKEYKMKMEIVGYLNDNGMNYWKTQIPSQIKENHDESYLDRY